MIVRLKFGCFKFDGLNTFKLQYSLSFKVIQKIVVISDLRICRYEFMGTRISVASLNYYLDMLLSHQLANN